nr:hypothetical protein [uncultured Dyadobacter sp.]
MHHLNPFYVRGKAVPPELVLAVRLLSVYLLVTGEHPFNGNQGSGRFYPLIDVLDNIGTDPQFNLGVQALFLGSIGVLLFSSWVRIGAFGAGLSFAAGLLSCQTCLSVAHMFTGCIFLCTSLSNAETGTDLIRFQLVVLYLGADLNKVSDPDWWTGASIETLLVTKHRIGAYIELARRFPPQLLSQVIGISIILLQLGIAALLCRRSTVAYATLLALLLHLPMVILMQMTFGPFLFALVVAYGLLLVWPQQIAGNARHSPFLIALLSRIDFNGQLVTHTAVTGRDSLGKWFRTGLDFISHPAILLFLTVLSAAMVRYGKLLPLCALVLTGYYIYVWPQRKPAVPVPAASA